MISLLFHRLVVFGVPYARFFRNKKPGAPEKKYKVIEMEPQKIEKVAKIQILPQQKPLPYVEDIFNRLIESGNLTPLQKPQIFENSLKEVIFSEIPFPSKELTKNPAYMDYYRRVRNAISTNAHRNYGGKVKGVVLTRFIISNDGGVTSVSLDSESINAPALKRIVLKSIKDAAPFPPFPAELSERPSIPFTVPIHFQHN